MSVWPAASVPSPARSWRPRAVGEMAAWLGVAFGSRCHCVDRGLWRQKSRHFGRRSKGGLSGRPISGQGARLLGSGHLLQHGRESSTSRNFLSNSFLLATYQSSIALWDWRGRRIPKFQTPTTRRGSVVWMVVGQTQRPRWRTGVRFSKAGGWGLLFQGTK